MRPPVERLPRGRHYLSREYIARHQRERLIAALAEALYEQGYERTTVEAIGRRAGVSKGDFYKLFANKDACFCAAYDDVVERFRASALAACAEAEEWAFRVRRGIAALFVLMASEPAQARLALVEGPRAGRGVYDRHLEALRSFVPHLRADAPTPPEGRPPAIDEAVVGGVASLLARWAVDCEIRQLAELLPQVAEFALTPYLGADEARRVIAAR
jgi:AcrR family transcriptional regulator